MVALRPPIVLCLLASAAALAGCTSPSASDGSEGDATPAADERQWSVPWRLTECRHAVWSAQVPDASVLQARVPEGFQVRSSPAGAATLGMEAFQCSSGSGLDGDVRGLQYGSLFVSVDAPDEYGCDGLDGGCYVKTDLLVPDAGLRQWLADAGVSAHDGSASVTVDAAGTWTASLVMDDVGGFGMQGVTLGPEQPGADLPFMEFMQGPDGVVVWTATTRDVAQTTGAGAWSADPGTWVEQEIGVAGPMTFSLGTWSFEGVIDLPGDH